MTFSLLAELPNAIELHKIYSIIDAYKITLGNYIQNLEVIDHGDYEWLKLIITKL